ncbi:hypothetical protein RS9916_34227 [Synechococcus sp. RS9916]|nr:hypothetical protein RS9916_34227 [Synechococcus sp. RS9916]
MTVMLGWFLRRRLDLTASVEVFSVSPGWGVAGAWDSRAAGRSQSSIPRRR